MVPPSNQASSKLLTAGDMPNYVFDIACGPGAETLALDTLSFDFLASLTTAGTGNTTWAGTRLGSNAIVKDLQIIVNGKILVDITDWPHYVNQRIFHCADYGINVDGGTYSGKFNEYYAGAQVVSASRFFKANIACNGLSDTKHVVDLSQLDSFRIRITLSGYNHCLYNTTGDPRMTISDMWISYIAGKDKTINAGDVMALIKVASSSLTSATTMNFAFPDEADCVKRVLIEINQTETNMTTNIKHVSDASTVTGLRFKLPNGTWPNTAIDSTYVKPLLYKYSQKAYSQSNPAFFTSLGLDYDRFYTASTDGFMAFNLAGESEGIYESQTAEYQRYGQAVRASSRIDVTQSAVTVAGTARMFQESLAVCSLDGSVPLRTVNL
jgi:hypothetical protein